MASAHTTVFFALAAILAHITIIAFLGTSPAGVLFSNLLQLFACGYAAFVCFIRMRRSSGFPRRFWSLIATGYLLWSAGQLILTYYEAIEHRTIPTLSPTDIPYLGYYLPLSVALLLTSEEAPGMDWVRTLDFSQVGIVLSSVYLYYFLYKASVIPTRWQALALGLNNVYDAFNIILVVAYTIRSLTARPRMIRNLYRRVLLYLVVYALGDALFTYAIVYWRARTGMWFDLAYSVPFLLAAVLAAWEVRAPDTEAASTPSRTSVWASALPILAPLFVLAIAVHIAGAHLGLASIILVASFLCSGARLGLTQFRQQRALDLLQSSEQRFRSMIEKSSDAIALLDGQARVLYLSPSSERLTGHKPEEFVGGSALERVHPDDVHSLIENFKKVAQTAGASVVAEYRTQRKDGRCIWIESVATNLLDDQNVGAIVVNFRDTTDRRKAEEILRASEERFSKAFHLSPNAMIISRLDDGRYIDVNERWLQMINLPREQAIGRSSLELNIWADPAERARLRDSLLQGSPVQSVEVAFRTSSGNRVLGLMSAELIELGGVRCILAAVQDITEKKQLEDQLRQAQKIEAIGRLAGGVAHDFNNLLTVIMGRSELLLLSLPPENPLHSDVEEIQRAGESAAGLTRQLLAFSRKQILEPKVLDLNSVVQDTQMILRRLIGEQIDILTRLEPSLGRIKADPGQIEQVILNLVINARDAMPYGGKVHIETSNVPLDETYARLHPPLIPGAYVRLEIRDTGEGMDSATRVRIFEPFFTTKEQGKGTGLGMATVHGIVKQSGGYIWVSSELGKGTSFEIYFPRVEEAVSATHDEGRAAGIGHGTETILIVEDDLAVRSVTSRLLHYGGYNVLEAGDGAQAVALAQRHAGPIHLLVTDVVLPGGSGVSISQQLASCRPQIKILYVSGYSGLSLLNESIRNGNSAFLQKPFGCQELLQKVRDLLDQ